MSGRLFLVGSVACMLVAQLPAVGQERQWLKFHEEIKFGDERIAEYTRIMTSDTLYPKYSRMLYVDEEGVQLVIRHQNTTATGSGTMSVKMVQGGELITVDTATDHQITVTVNGSSLSFADAEELPQSVKVAGAALLTNASSGFRDSLRRLAIVGSYYSSTLESLGFVLRELLFPEVQKPALPLPHNLTTEPTGITKGFDPSLHPPKAFESPFGDAYFQ